MQLDNESSSEGEDSEDKDDEPPESDDEDDGEREPIDNDIELEVEDEEGLMRAAAQSEQRGTMVKPSFETSTWQGVWRGKMDSLFNSGSQVRMQQKIAGGRKSTMQTWQRGSRK